MSEASISPTPTSKTAQSFVTEFTVFQGRKTGEEGGREEGRRERDILSVLISFQEQVDLRVIINSKLNGAVILNNRDLLFQVSTVFSPGKYLLWPEVWHPMMGISKTKMMLPLCLVTSCPIPLRLNVGRLASGAQVPFVILSWSPDCAHLRMRTSMMVSLMAESGPSLC